MESNVHTYMHSPIFPFLLTSKIKPMHSVDTRLHTYGAYADAKHTKPGIGYLHMYFHLFFSILSFSTGTVLRDLYV